MEERMEDKRKAYFLERLFCSSEKRQEIEEDGMQSRSKAVCGPQHQAQM